MKRGGPVGDLPFNLLDKLFFHVRMTGDDYEWVVADRLANYGRGWRLLAGAGLLEVKEQDVAVGHDIVELVVRFTKSGLAMAEERNISPKVREAMVANAEAAAVVKQRDHYASVAGWGQL